MIYRTNAVPEITVTKMPSKFVRRMKAIVRYFKLYYAYKKHYFFVWSDHSSYYRPKWWLKFVEVHTRKLPSKHMLLIEQAAMKDWKIHDCCKD